jgi:hypothetical protein
MREKTAGEGAVFFAVVTAVRFDIQKIVDQVGAGSEEVKREENDDEGDEEMKFEPAVGGDKWQEDEKVLEPVMGTKTLQKGVKLVRGLAEGAGEGEVSAPRRWLTGVDEERLTG